MNNFCSSKLQNQSQHFSNECNKIQERIYMLTCSSILHLVSWQMYHLDLLSSQTKCMVPKRSRNKNDQMLENIKCCLLKCKYDWFFLYTGYLDKSLVVSVSKVHKTGNLAWLAYADKQCFVYKKVITLLTVHKWH